MTPSISFPRLKEGLEPRAKAREASFSPGHLYAMPIWNKREGPKWGSSVASTAGSLHPLGVARWRDLGLFLQPPNKLQSPDSKSAASERDLEDSVCLLS